MPTVLACVLNAGNAAVNKKDPAFQKFLFKSGATKYHYVRTRSCLVDLTVQSSHSLGREMQN